MEDDAEVIAVLDALIDLLEEYEVSSWALALASDRQLLRSGHPDAYAALRLRFDADKLSEVWIALGDGHLNAVLSALRDRLQSLVAIQPEPESSALESVVALPPDFGERIEPEAPEAVRASDYPRGHVVITVDGYLVRSTWSVLDYSEDNRMKLVQRVWKPCEAVSVEEYRAIRRATTGWWITIFAAPVAAGGLVASAAVPPAAHVLVAVVCAVLMFIAVTMVGVMERRSSAVVGLYSRRTGMFVVPRSRGSSGDANSKELEEYVRNLRD